MCLTLFFQDYYESLEDALQGGVTLVQVREKDVDTGEVSIILWLPIGMPVLTMAVCRDRSADQGNHRQGELVSEEE